MKEEIPPCEFTVGQLVYYSEDQSFGRNIQYCRVAKTDFSPRRQPKGERWEITLTVMTKDWGRINPHREEIVVLYIRRVQAKVESNRVFTKSKRSA